MLKKFYPNSYVDSVFSIDYSKLYKMGYRGLIFDIDNTLVHHGEDSTPEIDKLFQYIQSLGFKTLLLSNNSQERVERFIKNINTLYIHNAEKPKKKNYLKAIKILEIKKEEAVVIGDQIFTDIFGANRSKLDNILVQYIKDKNETDIGKRRKLENKILKFYFKSKKYKNNKLKDITKKGNTNGKEK